MVKVIADVGSNFNNSFDLAKEYIEKCAEIGVDIVKFQTYTAETLFSEIHPAYEVIKNNTFGLPVNWLKELKEYADNLNIEFTTTPTALEHIDLLKDLDIKTYKIASGDLTFYPLIEKIAKTGKNIIISTGMANLREIKETISIIENYNNFNIEILHCVSNYPPKFEDVNLNSIKTLIKEFPNYKIGFSDHSKGDELTLAAVGMGSEIIEKHITLSKELSTPDAPFAMTIEKFGLMVTKVRNIEKAFGNGTVDFAKGEKDELFFARRGIFAKKDIKKGEIISIENINFLRPCKGIPASNYKTIIGKKAKENINKNSPIIESHLEI